ncbi:TonB-dependent receptor [soil metagenome]
MRTKTFPAIVLMFMLTAFGNKIFAQTRQGIVKGIITDPAGKRNLANATINVLDAKDCSLVSFGRSKDDGSFTIAKLTANDYVLLVTYTGFGKIQQPFRITNDKPMYDFNVIAMTSVSTLKDVEVTAAPIVIRGDTIEYNAASFKVNKPNAVVEDLLKKLPGVEVDKDGKITANGQEVKSVLVDGKQFFANDPKLATKNLQADMVNKVQVFDKKSDKSDFTGFDDGNSEPTINLTLKNDNRTGVFGKVSAGVGTEGHYQANANVNKFKKGEQLSFIGQANDINQQGFNLMDALSFSGGPSGGGMNMMNGSSGLNINGMSGTTQGITATQAAGLNYNNFKNSKLDFTNSYFYNGTQLNNDYTTRRESFVGDSTQLYIEPGSNQKNNYNHRLNLGLDWKIDSFNSIKITPSITYQNTKTNTQKTYSAIGPKGNILTDGLSNTTYDNTGYNFSTTALWRHRFAKKGRTFSTELKVGRNESNADGTQYIVNNQFVNGGGFRNDTLNQQSVTDVVAGSYSANISYTEPVSKRSLVEFNAWYNHNDNQSNKTTYDHDLHTGALTINNRLTNFFDNEYNYKGAGINYRENRKGWNYMVGTKFQLSELVSLLQGSKDKISQSFFNLLPNAQLQISKNRYRNFRLNYTGTTTQPSIAQLQPVEDISDPLNITIGNPDLKQSFNNNLRISYNSFDPYTMKSFFVFVTGKQTFNAIVNNDSLGAFGGKKTTYDNVDGVYNINANMAIGLPLKIGATKAKINFNTYASYAHNINLLNNVVNNINSVNLSENVSLNYTFKELFDIGAGGGVNWNQAKYSLQKTQNTNYVSYSGTFDFNIYLPKGFTLMTDVDYTANTGRAAGYNSNFTMWNASVAKSFLKNNKGELRFGVNDILNQNTGLSRSTNGNYIEDIRYTVLKRYAILKFTYSLNKFGNIGGSRGGPQIMMMGRPGM